MIQPGFKKSSFQETPKTEYYKLKDTLKIEPFIGNNKSGSLDNGETCKMATPWESQEPVETRYRDT